jgi:hypothetical protein
VTELEKAQAVETIFAGGLPGTIRLVGKDGRTLCETDCRYRVIKDRDSLRFHLIDDVVIAPGDVFIAQVLLITSDDMPIDFLADPLRTRSGEYLTIQSARYRLD